MKIGVGITTHNREEVTNQTVARWRALLPKDAVLVVVDDASDTRYPKADFRFENNVGIARAKNKCFELLEDQGVTEFFLADNDCYPKHKGWWKPYVESPEPHLSYQFLDLQGPIKLHDIFMLYQDDEHTSYSGQRGCLLYYNEVVLHTVGGFDPAYGRALYEHSDLANRIHAAGLTTWRYADLTNSHKIWHSMDEWAQVVRTIPQIEQNTLVHRNANMHNKRKQQGYKAFVFYREQVGTVDVLLTSFLTKNPDPQRGYKWDPNPDFLTEYLESVERNNQTAFVLADELRKLPKGYAGSQIVQVNSSTMNVYYQRWLHIYQYLRRNPQIRYVWCTDGTDVEVLRDPFKSMAPGKLYCGVERHLVSDTWMLKNHPAQRFVPFFKEYGAEPLLNAGVVGGDRHTVMDLAQKIVTLYYDIECDRLWEKDASKKDVGDMAAFNKVAYQSFGSRLVHGPEITTEFKAFTDNGKAKFRHK